MRQNLQRSLDFTLKFEGGYIKHPKDPGGHTNKGITLATLRRYRSKATVADLKNISDELVAQIYRHGYWDAVEADHLAAGVDGATFDYSVNSGPGAAKKSLMKVIGGPDHMTVKKLCARRLSIYQTFKHWKYFGKGWTRRITTGEALWVKWALAARVDEPHVREKLQDEATAAKMKSNQQAAGGAAAGGTGTAAPATTDQVPVETLDPIFTWIGAAAIAALLVFAAWLFWRAYVNRQRGSAYQAEAAQ